MDLTGFNPNVKSSKQLPGGMTISTAGGSKVDMSLIPPGMKIERAEKRPEGPEGSFFFTGTGWAPMPVGGYNDKGLWVDEAGHPGQQFTGSEWAPIGGGPTATAPTNPATQPPPPNPLANLPGQLSPSTTMALNDMNGGIGGMPQMGTNPNTLPAPAAPRPFYPVNGKLFGGSLFGRMNLKGY